MKSRDFPDFDQWGKDLKDFLEKFPQLAANGYKNFIQDNFRRQSFIDKTKQKWKARDPKSARDKGRKILVDTSRLKDSIRTNVKGMRIEIFTTVPYAKLHNEGGTIKKPVRVRAHKRRQRIGRKTRVIDVRSHERQMNLKMPKRQFMGKSAYMDKRLELQIERYLDQIFKR